MEGLDRTPSLSPPCPFSDHFVCDQAAHEPLFAQVFIRIGISRKVVHFVVASSAEPIFRCGRLLVLEVGRSAQAITAASVLDGIFPISVALSASVLSADIDSTAGLATADPCLVSTLYAAYIRAMVFFTMAMSAAHLDG